MMARVFCGNPEPHPAHEHAIVAGGITVAGGRCEGPFPTGTPVLPPGSTVEVWDGEGEDSQQYDARVVDTVWIENHWHFVVVADGI